MMNFIAVVVTLGMGYLGCSFFPDTNFANVFPIVTMGFFIFDYFTPRDPGLSFAQTH